MENIKRQCYKILELIANSQYYEEENYSIQRIKRAINETLEDMDVNQIKKINTVSLTRNFVDDTGDYASDILEELDILEKCIEVINQERDDPNKNKKSN
ncbi:hypothetical protein [Vagococcus silagei]|uniref:Uncharacterized protein n=1 Tax=Vagococcus silagei TaxID=2508885 RepID=A0A4S3B667_9ENTE|nr:hypothetical protein [Vagococcus silagei]THB62078.1 hypothetical protein ESZ54_02410 [Vagococcus silagei]